MTIMMQLLLATDLMHRKNIIHRDLKPDNILLEDTETWKVCITDLGLACGNFNFKELKVRCGTPGYVAPEVLKGTHPSSTKSDIFSLGCLMYYLIASSHLYLGLS